MAAKLKPGVRLAAVVCTALLYLALLLPCTRASVAFPRNAQKRAFFAWMDDFKVLDDGIALSESPHTDDGNSKSARIEDFGVFASDTLTPGTVIMKVPSSAYFMADNLKDTTCGRMVSNTNVEEVATLTLYFLCESRNASSRWRPWLDFMPRRVRTALKWPQSEFQEFPLAKRVRQTIQRIEDAYAELPARLKKLCGRSGSLTVGEFEDAYAVVLSRIFRVVTVTLNGEQRLTPAMVPLVDMINHGDGDDHATFRMGHYNDGTSAFVVQVTRSYVAGEEILTTYGLTSNDDLLLHYGFQIVDNPNNLHRFSIPPPPRPTPLQSRLLQAAGIGLAHEFRIHPGGCPLNASLVFYASLMATVVEDPAAAKLLASTLSFIAESGRAMTSLDIPCRRITLEYLFTLFRQFIGRGFQTSIDDDRQTVTAYGLRTPEGALAQYHMDQKGLIINAMGFVEYALALLNEAGAESEQRRLTFQDVCDRQGGRRTPSAIDYDYSARIHSAASGTRATDDL